MFGAIIQQYFLTLTLHSQQMALLPFTSKNGRIVVDDDTLPFPTEHSKAYGTYYNAQPCLDIRSLLPVFQKITYYSFTVLNICHPLPLPIHLTGHARPNSSNPIASGVCAQFPPLPHSVHLPQPFWNGGYESSLHPVVWKAALS